MKEESGRKSWIKIRNFRVLHLLDELVKSASSAVHRLVIDLQAPYTITADYLNQIGRAHV